MRRLPHAFWNAALALIVLHQIHIATPLFAQEPTEPTIGSRESFAGPPTQPTHVLHGHKYPVRAVAISPDLKTIASGGGISKLPFRKPGHQTISVKEVQALTQGEAFTWDLRSTKRKASLFKPPGIVIGLSFSPNGEVIGGCLQNSNFAVGPPQPAVVFWHAAKGKPAKQYMGLSKPMDLVFLPDGKSVIVDGGFSGPLPPPIVEFGKIVSFRFPGGVIRVLDYPALTVRQEIDLTKVNRPSNVHVDPMRVAYVHDQKAHVYDIATNTDSIIPAEIPHGLMRLSPDGKVMAILVAEKLLSLRFFSVETGTAIGKPVALIATFDPALAFSSDSRWLALTTGWAEDESFICLWDIANRKEIARFAGHTSGVNSLAFASDDSILVSGGNDKTVKIWKLPEK